MTLLFKQLRKHTIQNILFLSLFIFVICSRDLNIIFYGRFWAEEGQVFFYNAWITPPLHALFMTYGGYLNLPANLIPLIARWYFPLKYAPFFTSFIGLLFQLLPLFLLLTAKDKWLQSFRIRIFATLLLVFVPESEEISLQSLHIQFQLVLACAIIVTLSIDKTYLRWLKLIILTLAPLSGLMTFFLLPLYAFRSLLDKSYLRLEQFTVLLIANIIQISFFYTHFAQRHYHFSISDFLSLFFVRYLFMPFLGHKPSLSPYFLHSELATQPHHLPILSCSISILFFICIFYCLYQYPQTRKTGYFVAYALINLGLSIFGGLDQGYYLFELYVSQRYVFIGQALFCLTLLYFSCTLPKKGQMICNMLIFVLLISSIHNYYYYAFGSNDILPWAKQVKLWQKDPHYTFQLWPKGWTMNLPPS